MSQADRDRRYRLRNPEKRRAYQQSATYKASARRTQLKRKYGLTDEDYEATLHYQDYVCAICRKPETEKDGKTGETRRLQVDHDHDTGEARGLICGNCNRGLGGLQDSPDLLLRAYEYLKNPNPHLHAIHRANLHTARSTGSFKVRVGSNFQRLES